MQVRLHALMPTKNLLATRHRDGEFWHYEYSMATFFGNKKSMGKEQLNRSRVANKKLRDSVRSGEELSQSMDMNRHDTEEAEQLGLQTYTDEQGRTKLDLDMPGMGKYVCVISVPSAEDEGSFVCEVFIPAPFEKEQSHKQQSS